jgi:hypothetical protein
MESKEIIYYKRYIHNILIIFDQNKTDGKTIMSHIKNRDKHLEFKLSEEENDTMNYLDLSIHTNTNSIDIRIYPKPTHTDATIQFSSNHPLKNKLAAFNFYINRMLTPIYLLTPWSRVLLEKLTDSAASQEIPRIFGTRRFLTVPTSARHLSLS